MPSITNFQGVSFVAALETLLFVKTSPSYLGSDKNNNNNNYISICCAACAIFGLNYLLLFVYSAYIYPDFISPLRNFPRPRNWLFRICYTRLSGCKAPGQTFLDLDEETPNDGVLLLKALSSTRLLLTNTAALADIHVHHAHDFVKPQKIRNFLRQVLGDGLIIVEGDRHKFLRKNSLPAFSFRHIKDLYPMMWDKSLTFTDKLERAIQSKDGSAAGDAKVVEIHGWAGKVTLDIIGIAGLGREFNVLENSDDQLAKHYEALLEPSREKFLYFIMSTWVSARLTRLLPWKMNQQFVKRTSSLKSICNNLVREKREAVSEKGDDHFDILSLLIKSGQFTDDELSDQLLTYLAAGHETTSSAFTWACYLLSTRPEMQSKLRAEVREALATSTEEKKGEADIAGIMERLPYLNGIINETLRLYPTVPVTIRVARCDTHLAGHPIPKGTEVIISPWMINRSTKLWGPDAEIFRPERWIDDGRPNNMGGAPTNYHYMTFLHGPRSCIGQNFAKAELRCLIAAMVRRFEWDLAMDQQDVIPGGAITIKPLNGLHVRLRVASG